MSKFATPDVQFKVIMLHNKRIAPFISIILLVCTWIVFTSRYSVNAEPIQSGGTISGTVALFNDYPIDSLSVSLTRVTQTRFGENQLEQVPDDSYDLNFVSQTGGYQLSSIPPGIYKLKAMARSNSDHRLAYEEYYDNATVHDAMIFEIEDGTVYENINFVFGNGTVSIRGRVTDAQGQPLESVFVTAIRTGGQDNSKHVYRLTGRVSSV